MKTLTDVKRFNMIEQQIRTWDVFDASILDLYDKIKREAYVPEIYKKLLSQTYKFHFNINNICLPQNKRQEFCNLLS